MQNVASSQITLDPNLQYQLRTDTGQKYTELLCCLMSKQEFLGKIMEIFLEIIKSKIIILSLLNMVYKHVSILSGFIKSLILKDAQKTSVYKFVNTVTSLGF